MTTLKERLMRWSLDHDAKWCHVSAFITSLCLAFFLVLLLYRSSPVDVMASHFLSSPLYAGTNATVEWTAEERRHGCGGTVYRTWIDSNDTSFEAPPEAIVFHNPLRHIQTFRRELPVPAGMAAGPGIYTSWAVRWCNPVQWFWPMTFRLPEIRVTIAAD